MSIRTTITLDDDVLDRVKRESRARGASFRDTVYDLLRAGLFDRDSPVRRKLEIRPMHMGYKPGLNHDDVESLIEYGEGEQHR